MSEIKQISVFIENKKGRLFDVAKNLSSSDINIRALSLAETADFGVLRLIVNEPDKAFDILKNFGFSVAITKVVAIEVPDRIGGLSEILKVLDDNDINVEYMYAFVEKLNKNAILIFRFENVSESITILHNKSIRILSESEVLSL